MPSKTPKRSRRAFWPGFKWRILAHTRTAANSRGGYTGGMIDLRSDDPDRPPTVFDELVIDNWLHLEQMNGRSWWIGLGTAEDGIGYEWMIYVGIDRDGKATVHMEKDG